MNRKKERPGNREFNKPNLRLLGDRSKLGDVDKAKGGQTCQESDDKLVALKDFRRKNGLCFKCDEKWAPNHVCSPKVSLHVIEELLDAITAVDSVR